jgi:peptide/nickel transport system substrate-binding protein
MIDALLEAKSREDFVSAVRALDRILLSGFYAVPLFYVKDQWLAYDSDLKKPSIAPLMGTTIDVWWRRPH